MSLASRLIKAIFATEAGVLTAASSPAAADKSKKIATTEWAAFGFAILKAGDGYIKFPTWMGGLVVQWGTGLAGPNSTDFTNSFPTAFSAPPFIVIPVHVGADALVNVILSTVIPASTTTFTMRSNYAAEAVGCRWIAIGA